MHENVPADTFPCIRITILTLPNHGFFRHPFWGAKTGVEKPWFGWVENNVPDAWKRVRGHVFMHARVRTHTLASD